MLISSGYLCQTFYQYIENPSSKVVILRHDVDKLPENALKFAKIEYSLGVKGTYYFRSIPCSYNESIIMEIAKFEHEIGYHYETLDLCKGNIENAYRIFCNDLEIFRKIYHVKTICMHGSPISIYNNGDIWKKFNYYSLGIIGEPYFDIDYSKMHYFTDTGRRWNNQSSNVRDKIIGSRNIQVSSTKQLISYIGSGKISGNLMINTHPQRWFDGGFGWYKELVGQNTRNMAKYILLRFRDSNK